MGVELSRQRVGLGRKGEDVFESSAAQLSSSLIFSQRFNAENDVKVHHPSSTHLYEVRNVA